MLPVYKRGGFSDRNGIHPCNTTIQLKNFDEPTRVAFFNAVIFLYDKFRFENNFSEEAIQEFCRYILRDVYSQPLKIDKKYYDDDVFDLVKETLMKDSYDMVLTVIEAIINYLDKNCCRGVYQYFNGIFKKEYVGYRFIGAGITPISDELEIETITTAFDSSFKSVREHIEKATLLLSDKKKPDYENSIKESISAVEATCQELLGKKGNEATLGKMLNNLEKNNIVIHSALKAAFNSLYGYTSDANGIRHAGNIGGPTSTFEDAKFMLVSCSAFVNYLIGVKCTTT